ncbi:hypothetical protein OC835_005394 [Tilletia horrida]|uniref:4a-hydroxytetrahydrobiopterin dehydratase n=1 Tax=Tilletia horrida TaxID=155126 RepID=A0AAN6GDV1_9BASI|nr:hypothetical protein OC835_005394 [Tilletia horrida]KAK0536138.1 hypothetical protein OC842_002086 [Tilletia horrida]KAK0559122.1 hypothetical protein OC844_004640 [Tilletia horrida]
MSSSSLGEGSCEPCKKGGEALSPADAQALLSELNASCPPSGPESAALQPQPWSITPRPLGGSEPIPALERTFLFRNFRHALAFTNAVGEVAEKEGHHPALLTEWGSVRVAWWTHVIGGLHRNDFIMAAKTDAVFADAPGKKKASVAATSAAQ